MACRASVRLALLAAGAALALCWQAPRAAASSSSAACEAGNGCRDYCLGFKSKMLYYATSCPLNNEGKKARTCGGLDCQHASTGWADVEGCFCCCGSKGVPGAVYFGPADSEEASEDADDAWPASAKHAGSGEAEQSAEDDSSAAAAPSESDGGSNAGPASPYAGYFEPEPLCGHQRMGELASKSACTHMGIACALGEPFSLGMEEVAHMHANECSLADQALCLSTTGLYLVQAEQRCLDVLQKGFARCSPEQARTILEEQMMYFCGFEL